LSLPYLLNSIPGPPDTGKIKMKSKAMNFSRFGRYEDAIKSAGFKKALARSIKANPERKACKAGHDLVDPKQGHIHVGDLKRTGYRTCRTCWKKHQKNYEAKLAKKAAKKVVK
jgi:hypothetical protein